MLACVKVGGRGRESFVARRVAVLFPLSTRILRTQRFGGGYLGEAVVLVSLKFAATEGSLKCGPVCRNRDGVAMCMHVLHV